jgi:hypothetical protein
VKNSAKDLEEEIQRLYYLVNRLDRKVSEQSEHVAVKKSASVFPAKPSEDHYKRRLVGNLPYVLLDKKYFPTNDLLVKFAEMNLKLNIKFAKSKSRDALIGSIIVEVSNKDPKEIRKFYHALQKIIGKDVEVGVKDFFGEWNRIIKSL